MTPTIALRPVTPDDGEFLYRVYAHTRYEELAVTGWPAEQVEAFLRMQFHAQTTFYREHLPDTKLDVILCDSEPAGRLYVDRRPDELHIVDIALLPAFRRRGLGTTLLTGLLTEAAGVGVPVRIHVEMNNAALRLYERLGFVRIDDVGVYYLMEWHPSRSSQPPTP